MKGAFSVASDTNAIYCMKIKQTCINRQIFRRWLGPIQRVDI